MINTDMYTGIECFLCGRNGCADPLDRHHVFGGGLRKKSERYGLVVDLCHHRCHEYGEAAAHQNEQTMDKLHRWGQRKAMIEQGWSVDEFVRQFGKNYLSEDELRELEAEGIEPERYGSFAICDDAELPY